MNAAEFYRRHRDEVEALCQAVGTNLAYFQHLAYGNRRPSAELCVRIERASEGRVTRAELRPDLFGDPLEPPKAGAFPQRKRWQNSWR